jgi:hypothetical protein
MAALDPAPKGNEMRLTMILYSMIGTALAGSAIIAVLTLGYVALWPILGAAVVGAVVAVPVSWLVARQIA